MRHSRIRPDWQDTWHHAYNRTAGNSLDRPLDTADKEMFVRILHRVARLYTVRVAAYQFMSNHFHLLLHAPMDVPSEEETCQRFEAFHNGKRHLIPGSQACREWQARLRDVSWFMRHLQHLYTVWHNRTRPIRRRGPLWAGRFKNTILESGASLLACWTYIEFNPVRAGMVSDPANYRFSSYGAWAQSGRHPFAENAMLWLLPALPESLAHLSLESIQARIRQEFAKMPVADAHRPDESKPWAKSQAGKLQPLALVAQHRVRYWTDGLVIGTALFVREIMSHVRPHAAVERHRLAVARDNLDATPICSWRRLRVLQT